MTQLTPRAHRPPTRLSPGLREPGRPGRLVGILMALLCFGATASAEEEVFEVPEPDWIPSLSVGFDTFSYDTDQTYGNLVNPPRNTATGSSSVGQFQLDVAAELMGPAFAGPSGRLRPFARVGVQANPFASDEVFSLGTPGDVAEGIQEAESLTALTARLGCGTGPAPCPTLPLDNYAGEGGSIDAEFETGFGADLGLAWGWPVGENLLFQLKPSVAYQYERIDFSASLTTVFAPPGVPPVRTVNPGPSAPSGSQPVDIPVTEIHSASASEKVSQHYLGPGLELALTFQRLLRPVRVTLYADARFLWLLSDRTVSFSDGSVGAYEVRQDPFSIRGGAGLRLSWMGFGR